MHVDAYICESAITDARRFFKNQAKKGREGIGFLVGEALTWRSQYVVVRRFLTARNASSAASARLVTSALARIAAALRSEVIVGWAHSHLGLGCFLSQRDLRTHLGAFREPWHVALVIDPIKGEEALFKVGAGGVTKASWAIVEG